MTNSSRREPRRASVLAAQFRSPLLLLLVFAAIVAAMAGEWIDAAVVAVVVPGERVLLSAGCLIPADATIARGARFLRQRGSAHTDATRESHP